MLSMLSWKTKIRKTQSDWQKNAVFAWSVSPIVDKVWECFRTCATQVWRQIWNPNLQSWLQNCSYGVPVPEFEDLLEVCQRLWGDFPQLWARVGSPQGVYVFLGQCFCWRSFQSMNIYERVSCTIAILVYSVYSVYHSTEFLGMSFLDFLIWIQIVGVARSSMRSTVGHRSSCGTCRRWRVSISTLPDWHCRTQKRGHWGNIMWSPGSQDKKPTLLTWHALSI